jgi:amino acid adenylation domain-containing protein
MPPAAVQPWESLRRQAFPHARLFNAYGPTETVITATLHEVRPEDANGSSSVSIGTPSPGRSAYVADRHGHLQPSGIPGELWLGGLLARGYLGDSARTAERFIPDPFGPPGGRLYRTGDLVRREVSGDLTFLGRFDQQVKIRGFRVELGEIEAALTSCLGVREAVAVAVGEGEERRLAAFFVAAPDLDPARLRDHLRAQLPAPLVPAALVPLPALPLTPNGKVDRRALPDPFAAGFAARREEIQRPRTPAEEVVAAIWCDVLELPEVGLGESFFDLGGHSLLAIRVGSRLRAAFGVELPLRDLFEQPTVEGHAGRVEEALRQAGQAPAPPIVRAPRDRPLPLSFAQQRLWFLDQMEPGGTAYNIPFAVRLDGPLRIGLLREVFAEIVRRHEALRTRFDPRSGDPVQVIDPPAPLALPVVDLTLAPEAEAGRLASILGALPFDLARGPLLRTALLRLASDRHLLLGAMHHIVSDEWSERILLREMVALYRALGSGLPPPLPALPVQYADFAVWQRRWLQGEALDAQLAFWRRQLAGPQGEPPVLELPADRPRPAIQSYRGDVLPLRLPEALARSLQALSRRAGATPFMTLLAAFAALLGRHTGQTDLAIGTPISGRTRLEVEGLIGFFLNTLVLRLDLSGDPGFSGLLAQVRERALAAYAHQDVPFEKLVDELRPRRSLAHAPLFQALFVLTHETPLEEEMLGVRLAALPAAQKTAKFDLSLMLTTGPGGLAGLLEYAADLFDRSTVARFADRFERLLAALVDDPERPVSAVALSSPAEVHQILCEWNEAGLDAFEDVPVHEMFARVARRRPDAQAFVWENGSWTFAELEERAERLAGALRAQGVGPEVPVGVLAERGPDLAVALLGILKAGGAYLPLDPAYPRERLDFMIADSGARVVLKGGEEWGGEAESHPEGEFRAGRIWAGERSALPDPSARSSLQDDSGRSCTAYVIYTSGSTGRPKGIALPHRTLSNLISWQMKALAKEGIDPCLRTLQLSSPSFDVSFQETFATWCAGAALVVGPEEARRDPRLLVEILVRERIERIFLPYVALQQLAEHLAGVDDPVSLRLREVVTAGERLQITPQIAAMFRRLPGCALRNQYGPSETHVATEHSLLGDPGRWPVLPPVGRPLTGTASYVIDRSWRPVPLGVAGELAIGGVSLAQGYIKRPDLTAEKFIPDPFSNVAGARLYCSGDLARLLPDGAIEFLGRVDDQVKIRGFRIEPGEIEVALAAHPQVREAVVVARGDGSAAGRRLVAYVTPMEEEVSVNDLRGFLRGRLPEYMVPAAFVVLAALPLTASGKVQRSALPEPEEQRAAPYVPPASLMEQRVAEVVEAQLGGRRVGREDNFFDAGAHSLLLVRVAAELERRLGRKVAVVDLFRFPTVTALARHLGEGGGEEEAPVFAARARKRAPHPRPLSHRSPPARERGATAREEEKEKKEKRVLDRRREQMSEEFEQIAIIGMACRFPGADDPGAFWRNVRDGVESITRFSDAELAAEGVPAAQIADPSYVKARGVIEGPELFDADFFGFTPREAEIMDPQQRLFLECAWQACEDAGYVPQTVPGRIGVYGGAAAGTYVLHCVLSNPEIVAAAGGMQVKLLNDKDFLTTHVSYKLNLRGPSMAIQTACSTSLVAVHVACQALLDGECDMALAGGTGISFPHRVGTPYQEGGINSPDGHCRAFDIRAQGLVDGNGTGMVLLKRLSDAIADGDFIYAVVRGSAINNDGALKVGYTSPSVESQMEVIGEALAAARVEADTIGLVEAHGSGTPIGDPIEVQALTRAFRATSRRTGYCALGSVKTNIGHTDAAAGVAGLIKAVQSLKHRQIPPSLHFETPNPALGLAESPFFVLTRAQEWPGGQTPRRAGVSSLGIGGTNAHVVLEEAPPAPAAAPSRPWQLLVLSARSREALDRSSAQLAEHLSKNALSRFELADAAHTLRVGRKAFPFRRALLCRDRSDAMAALADPSRWIEGTALSSGERPVAFLFPGLGEHYAGMAAGLYRAEPVFRAAIDRSAEILGPHLGVDLRELLVYWEGGAPVFERAPRGGAAQPDLRRLLAPEAEEEDEASRQLNRTAFAHPAVFAVEHALAELWLAWGVRPQAMIGYSLGEYVAACLAGVFSLEDGLALVAGRARLIDGLPAGAMVAVPLSVPETEALLGGEPELALAAANGSGLSVVAGPEEAASAFARRLAERGVACRRLRTGHAFHSPMMRPAAAELTRLAAGLELRVPRIPFVSNVTGTWITEREATDPGYWAEHLCRPVQFAAGLGVLQGQQGQSLVLVEVGPGQTLGTLARQRPGRPAGEVVVGSLRDRREELSDQAFLLDALGRLWAAGVAPDWTGFSGAERRRRVPLPTYPFERRRYYLAPGLAALGAAPAREERRALGEWFYAPSWERAPLAALAERTEPLRWLLVGDGAGLAERLEERLAAGGEAVARVAWPVDYRALLTENVPRRIVHLASLDPGDALENGFYSVLALAQALSEIAPEHRAGLHVGVVTSGVAAVLGDEALVPERAALLGPCRVLPQEVPGVTCTAIDLLESDLRSAEKVLIEELARPRSEPVIALRGRHGFLRRFRPVELPAMERGAARLRQGGVYLITGGLDETGVVLAEQLFRACGARLALLAPEDTPPMSRWGDWLSALDERSEESRRLRRILALERAGCDLLVTAADLAHPGQVRQAIDLALSRFGTIHGAVHAAGRAGAGLMQWKTRSQAASVLSPKVPGTRVLAEALADQSLDFFVLFGSNASVTGGFGQSDTAAGAAALDAFAEARGLPVQAIDWGFFRWQPVTAANPDMAAALEEGLAQLGIGDREMFEVFLRVLAAPLPQVIVSTQDLDVVTAQLDSFSVTALLDEIGRSGSSHARPELPVAYETPQGEIEETVAHVWQEAFGIDRVGREDNFFDLSGNSLLAIQIVTRISQALDIDLATASLLEAPTVAGLAQHIDQLRTGAPPATVQTVQAVPTQPAGGIPRRAQQNHCPLSLDQERLWFIQQLDLASPIYNIYSAHRHKGPLDVGLLTRALNLVIARHEVLRTRFPAVDGRPVQEIAPALSVFMLVVDLRGLRQLPLDVREGEAYRVAMMAGREPFDLSRLPLLRSVLVQVDDEDFIHPIAVHHIITDRVASYVFENEVTQLYYLLRTGQPPVLPEPGLQFADFAVWQRHRLEDPAFLEEHLAYWREKLAGAPELSTLPPDRPRPAVQTPWGARRRIALTLAQAEEFRAFSKAMDVTMFIAGLAVWKSVLVRLSGQETYIVGTPMNYRQTLDLPHVLGFYLNQIPLSTDLSGDPTFREILGRVRTTSLGAYAHHDLPFAKIVERLRPERDLSRVPYTQVVFLLLDPPQQGWASMPGVESRPYWLDAQRTQFDMNMALFWVEETGLTGMLEYNTDLFDAVTMDRVKEQFRMVLTAVLADPDRRLSDLPLLSEAQRHQVVHEWGTARRELPPSPAASLHGAFASQVERNPEAVAVVCDGAALTYGELNRRANRLAHRLLALGAQGETVALAAERGLDLVAGILGILKAGCAYVPIDPEQPAERQAFLLEDSGAAVLVSDGGGIGWGGLTVSFPEAFENGPDTNPLGVFQDPGAPAYVIYTSGSTGKPKGVVVTHGNVLRLFRSTEPWFGFGPGDVWTLFHSFAFDFSVWELWGALLHGGRLVVVPYWVSRSPEAFLELLARERVTVLNQTPKAFRQLIPAAVAPGAPALSLRWVIFGGEALQARSLAPWVERFGDGSDRSGSRGPGLVNMYGITETTVHVTWHRVLRREVESGWGSRIGVPIPDLSLRVLDQYGQPVPMGVEGEMCVGGPGLAMGYLGRPDLTAERFVPDPWNTPGARLYRSGDLGCFRTASDLEYLRRADQQVKVRGFRIELGEIEAALAGHPRIAAAAVLALPQDGSGDLRLVAYVVGADGEAPKVEELRAHLARRLPEHMLPAVFVPLAALPLTANGKLDRRALPAPGAVRPELAAAYVPPETAAERALAAIWAELLGVEKVGIHDNFFSLGGDSIVSLRVVALAAKQGLSITLQDIFRQQTIAAVAMIARASEATVPAGDRGVFSLVSDADRERLPEDVEDAYPLTRLQAGMLYHMALTREEPLYHNVGTFHLRGRFEPDAFREAVDWVVARHPVLRTSFDLAGGSEPLQLVHGTATLPIEVEDWRMQSTPEQEAAVARRVALEKRRLFDLTRAPQMRMHAALRSSSTFQLTLVENHAIFDGWSLQSTLAEIFDLYFALLAGERPPAAAPPSLTFREYVRRERGALAAPEAAAFWSRIAEDLPPAELPAWPQSGPLRGRRVRTLRTAVPPALFATLKEIARRAGVPVKSVLLAAHLRVQSHLSGRPGVVTGLVTNGRLEESGGDEVRGLFLNTLPLGLELPAGRSWLDLVREAFRAEEEMLPYRRYPFAEIQRLAGDRLLYEVAFNYVHFHVARGLAESGRLEVLGLEMIEGASFKLLASFAQTPSGDGLTCDLEYDAHEMPDAQVQAIAGTYLRCLAALTAAPETPWEEAPLLSEAERHQIRVEWNDALQVSPLPEIKPSTAVALSWDGGQLTYEELNARADQLARHLLASGAVARPEEPIGVRAGRGPALAVAFLAILKAGGAYLPLDPNQPEERLALMLEDAGCATVLEPPFPPSPGGWEGLPEDTEGGQGGEGLAYLIYTSGSTGRPKGIALPHRVLANFAAWQIAASPHPAARTLQLAAPSFDVSLQEMLVTWFGGGTLVVAPEEARRDPAVLARLLREERIERLFLPYVALQQLAEHLTSRAEPSDLPADLREVITAGERLQVTPQIRALFQALPGCTLRNQYGPSETHVLTEHVLSGDPESWPALPPIGRPIANTRAFVLDRALRPVPIGVPGELLLGGQGVARGYIGHPDWTAERFLPDGLSGEPGERLYRTGDLVRLRPDGAIEFLGRIDHQVKIRGFRVEPEEIEAALQGHPAVREAAVIPVMEERGAHLVAFVVAEPLEDLPGELRRFLAGRLPSYMVPAAFVELDALPLTRSGKVDRRALLAALPDSAAGRATAVEYVPPASPLEERLAEVFAEVLGLPAGRVGMRDNFFDLGGHSLSATRALAILADRWGIEIPLSTLFNATDLGDLADRIIERELEEAPDNLVEELLADLGKARA